MNDEDSYSWHSCTERTSEWMEKGSDGVFGVIIYTRAHQQISFNFSTFIVFMSLARVAWEFHKKIWGLRAWGYSIRDYRIWVITIMLDTFFLLIPRVCVVSLTPHLVLSDLAAVLTRTFGCSCIHVYVVYIWSVPVLWPPMSSYLTPPFPASCVLFFVYGKKAPSYFEFLRWENWMQGVFYCLTI